jgi:hypothetical protein
LVALTMGRKIYKYSCTRQIAVDTFWNMVSK